MYEFQKLTFTDKCRPDDESQSKIPALDPEHPNEFLGDLS